MPVQGGQRVGQLAGGDAGTDDGSVLQRAIAAVAADRRFEGANTSIPAGLTHHPEPKRGSGLVTAKAAAKHRLPSSPASASNAASPRAPTKPSGKSPRRRSKRRPPHLHHAYRGNSSPASTPRDSRTQRGRGNTESTHAKSGASGLKSLPSGAAASSPRRASGVVHRRRGQHHSPRKVGRHGGNPENGESAPRPLLAEGSRASSHALLPFIANPNHNAGARHDADHAAAASPRKANATRGAFGTVGGDERRRPPGADTVPFHSPVTYDDRPRHGSPKRGRRGRTDRSSGDPGTAGWQGSKRGTSGGLGGVGGWQSNTPAPDVRTPSHLGMQD